MHKWQYCHYWLFSGRKFYTGPLVVSYTRYVVWLINRINLLSQEAEVTGLEPGQDDLDERHRARAYDETHELPNEKEFFPLEHGRDPRDARQ